MKELRAVYFDFDGVLTLDTNGSTTTFRAMHGFHGGETETGLTFDQFYAGYSNVQGKRRFMHPLEKGEVIHADVWGDLCEAMGVDMNIKFLADAFRSTEMHPEMLYVAQRLSETGYVVGMITDNPKDRMQEVISHYNLDRIFNPIVVSSDRDVGTLKKDSDARAYGVAEERSRIPLANSLFIDNSAGNVASAESQGLPAVLYGDTTLRDDFGRRRETAIIERMLRGNGLNF